MSNVVPYRPPAELTYRQERDVVDGWARHWSAVLELVPYIADSEFVPEAMRGNKPQIAACILAGREMGLGPMTALQHVHVIQGTPALSAHMQRALALAAGCEIHYVERSGTRCVVRGRRPGAEHWEEVVWTLDEARQRGITSKKNWREMPRQMLTARATGELCRLIAADALAGMPYNAEELDDGPDRPALEAPKPEPRRTVKRAGGTVAHPVPPAPDAAAPPTGDPTPPSGVPLPGEDGYDDLGVPQEIRIMAEGRHAAAILANSDEDPIPEQTKRRDTTSWPRTELQSKKLFAMLGNLGIRDRELGLAFISLGVGRPVETSKDLTRAEARGLIDFLTLAESSDELSDQIAAIVSDPNPIAALNRFAGMFTGDPGEVLDAEVSDDEDEQ